MSSLTSQHYNLGRPAEQCAASGAPLTPGTPFVAALVEREGVDGFDRLDFTQEAWASMARPARLVGFWRGIAPEPDAAPKPFIDDEALLSLFEQLGESDDPKRQAFRFVLALMLVRKRLLRHEGSRKRQDGDVMLIRMRGPEGWGEGSTIVEVVDPNLDRETIGQVTEQVGQILRGDL
ncbi:MAG: hypothetical protein VYC34_07630 [Planctomycetota bacterium]|nr:hypothetical protein [Planctomycetota bacterium]